MFEYPRGVLTFQNERHMKSELQVVLHCLPLKWVSESQKPKELTDTDAQPAGDLVGADNSQDAIGVRVQDGDAPQPTNAAPGPVFTSVVRRARKDEALLDGNAMDDLTRAGHPMDDSRQWVETWVIVCEEGVEPASEKYADPLRILGEVLF